MNNGVGAIVFAVISTLLIVLIALSISNISYAHQAPTGWAYPYACCHNKDCREVSAKSINSGPEGYQVPSGDIIPYGDKRIRFSPDGKFHWCSLGGLNSTRTICLFVPPGMS